MKGLTARGYYDGANVRLLEEIAAKPNQKVIVTIIDEFMEPTQRTRKKSLRGALSAYADADLTAQEKGAWERAAAEKHGHI